MATQRHPSKGKAREMLHNPPNGKKLSDKQRRYFGWLASKQMGGEIDPNGYLESNLQNYTDQKIIPGGNITTEGMAFPITANGQPLYPNTGDYQFDSDYVVEKPMYQQGGLTRGLIPQMIPSGYNPNTPSGVAATYYNNYLMGDTNYFPSLHGEAPRQIREKAQQGTLGVYDEAIHRGYLAAQRSVDNLMTPQQINQELNRPYVLPPDAVRPKKEQGGEYRFQLGGGVNYENTSEFSNNHLNRGKNYDKAQWDMYDNASYFIEQGINPLQAQGGLGQAFIANHGQAGRDAITGISMFNQDPTNRGLSPEARLRKFYSQTQSNPQLEQLRMIGASTTDPYGAYKRSNNVISQGQYTAQDLIAAKPAFWQGGQYRY